jgi:hypothetical protein
MKLTLAKETQSHQCLPLNCYKFKIEIRLFNAFPATKGFFDFEELFDFSR